jgi:hypothetical protein
MLGTRNGFTSCLVKSVFVTAEKEIESQLRGVSSGQPQLFAKIARSHDLRVLPEQLLWCFFSPVLRGHVVSCFLGIFAKCVWPVPC